MTIRSFLVASCITMTLLGCTHYSESNGWINLFNSENLNNWSVKINHYEVGENFGNTFRFENEILKVRYDQYDFTDEFGHIFYKTPFKNFHLSVDYRFSGEFEKNAPTYAELNSGVMFFSQGVATLKKDQGWPISIEMQYLADLGDGKRTTGNMCSPGTNIRYQGKTYTDHCLNSNMPALPKEQWVTAELIVRDSNITHLINGKVVLEYSQPTIDAEDKIITGQDPQLMEGGKALQSGYIALQSEGQPIEFKNVRIEVLK